MHDVAYFKIWLKMRLSFYKFCKNSYFKCILFYTLVLKIELTIAHTCTIYIYIYLYSLVKIFVTINGEIIFFRLFLKYNYLVRFAYF